MKSEVADICNEPIEILEQFADRPGKLIEQLKMIGVETIGDVVKRVDFRNPDNGGAYGLEFFSRLPYMGPQRIEKIDEIFCRLGVDLSR